MKISENNKKKVCNFYGYEKGVNDVVWDLHPKIKAASSSRIQIQVKKPLQLQLTSLIEP